MADVTIINQAGTTFTFAQGETNGVKSQIAGDVEQSSFPGSGPSNTLLFDFNGPVKIISIGGQLFETAASRTDSGSTTTILEQKQWLEQNINGIQTALTFSSTYESQTYDGTSFVNTQVAFGAIDFEEQAGNPEELNFNIRFVVGA